MIGHLTYPGDVTSIVGSEFYSPRMLRGDVDVMRWVATDAAYDVVSDKTRVEFDGSPV